MEVWFDADFDGGSWPGPLNGRKAVAGEAWLGPLGASRALLEWRDPEISAVHLFEPASALPELWKRVLAAIAARGTRIADEHPQRPRSQESWCA